MKIREFIEFIRVVWRYYGNRTFRKADWLLIRVWFLRNPYRVCRQYLESLGASDVYAYGETALTSLEAIVEQCGITEDDTVFELGCGRGRSCLWLRCIKGCTVKGIDFVPRFIQVANYVIKRSGLDRIGFEQADITQLNYSSASVVYLYGTGFDRATLTSLAEAMERLSIGAKVITISYSMNDYCPRQQYEVEKIFPVKFNWGVGQVFLQKKISLS